jgi:hypothetical protein
VQSGMKPFGNAALSNGGGGHLDFRLLFMYYAAASKTHAKKLSESSSKFDTYVAVQSVNIVERASTPAGLHCYCCTVRNYTGSGHLRNYNAMRKCVCAAQTSLPAICSLSNIHSTALLLASIHKLPLINAGRQRR